MVALCAAPGGVGARRVGAGAWALRAARVRVPFSAEELPENRRMPRPGPGSSSVSTSSSCPVISSADSTGRDGCSVAGSTDMRRVIVRSSSTEVRTWGRNDRRGRKGAWERRRARACRQRSVSARRRFRPAPAAAWVPRPTEEAGAHLGCGVSGWCSSSGGESARARASKVRAHLGWRASAHAQHPRRSGAGCTRATRATQLGRAPAHRGCTRACSAPGWLRCSSTSAWKSGRHLRRPSPATVTLRSDTHTRWGTRSGGAGEKAVSAASRRLPSCDMTCHVACCFVGRARVSGARWRARSAGPVPARRGLRRGHGARRSPCATAAQPRQRIQTPRPAQSRQPRPRRTASPRGRARSRRICSPAPPGRREQAAAPRSWSPAARRPAGQPLLPRQGSHPKSAAARNARGPPVA
jgi:hypothetical protein